MADLDDWQLEPIEIAHEFEIDLNCVVIVNHNLVLEGINRSEDEDLENLGTEDPVLRTFYEDLRRAAHNLAMVGLVTRLQHWVSRFVRQLPLNQKPPKSDKPMLVSELDFLNDRLGEGPIPVSFFAGLVTVRDSVIHGDSKAEWNFRGNLRRVVERYTRCGKLELTKEQLKEAIQKAIQQVEFYDDRLHEIKGSVRASYRENRGRVISFCHPSSGPRPSTGHKASS